MKQERVSILIPCFNAEAHIAATIDSVIGQTYPEIEIVVADDGSSDRSAEIVLSFDDPRIRLLTGSNSGAAAARNAAFHRSDGKYVLFLDADDLIAPAHIEALTGALKGGGSGVACGQWDRFVKDQSEACFPERPTNRSLDGPTWVWLNWQRVGMTQCGMFLIPRALVDRFGGWDERLSLADDFEFFARILTNADQILYTPDARLYYRSGLGESLSGRKDRVSLESAFLSISLGTQHLLNNEDSHRTRSVCANIFQCFEYENYPFCPDLRAKARRRVRELGGADIAPTGPPGFHKLRRLVGWRIARRAQHAAGRLGLKRASRMSTRTVAA
ncbi:MAG: glycosyltransferase [bacterium]|nr:glycosyltransferase [bacterium]